MSDSYDRPYLSPPTVRLGGLAISPDDDLYYVESSTDDVYFYRLDKEATGCGQTACPDPQQDLKLLFPIGQGNVIQTVIESVAIDPVNGGVYMVANHNVLPEEPRHLVRFSPDAHFITAREEIGVPVGVYINR